MHDETGEVSDNYSAIKKPKVEKKEFPSTVVKI